MIKDTKGWVTVAQLANVLGLTVQGVRASILPAIDDEHVNRKIKPMTVFAPAVVEHLIDRESKKRRSPDDPLLAGDTDSPGLERYRLAKAEHAELDLAERRGELITVERGRQWLMSVMTHIRQFGDRLRSHPDLQVEFADMLNDCKRAAAQMDDHAQQQ